MAKRKDDGCPLYRHKRGQWRKKINGVTHYFGTDLTEALQRYKRSRWWLERGQTPPEVYTGMTIADCFNLWLQAGESRVATKEISHRHWKACAITAKLVFTEINRDTPVDVLLPADFEKLRGVWMAKYALDTTAGHIRRVRLMLNWCHDEDKVETPVRMGKRFCVPSAKQRRLERLARPKELWTANEVAAFTGRPNVAHRGMCLMAINCAFIPCDLGRLRWSDLDLSGGWVTLHRHKTAVERSNPLWAETVDTLRELSLRQHRHAASVDDLVFRTERGNPYWTETDNSRLAMLVRQWRTSLEIEHRGRSFKTFRKTFQTIADRTGDYVAVKSIMGHVDNSMSGHYRQEIFDQRKIDVAEYVRQWYLSGWPGLKVVGDNSQGQVG